VKTRPPDRVQPYRRPRIAAAQPAALTLGGGRKGWMEMLKTAAFAGVSWLAFMGAASAQEAIQTQHPAAPADPRDVRIHELEQRLEEIEAQIEDLKASSAADVQNVRDTAAAQPTISVANGRPTIASADGNFRFSVRGLAQFDLAHYDQDSAATPDNRRGDTTNASDLNSGGNFRRARIGVEGTAFRDWNYALTYEMGGTGSESPALNQAYVEYTGWKLFNNTVPLRFRIGAWATPTGLEDATSNTESLFLERAAPAELVRGLAGGDGRSSIAVFANGERWYGSAALTGGIVGNSGEYDEQTGYLLRAAFLPLKGQDYGLHVGANVSGIIEPADTDPSALTQERVRLRERPELRNDTTRFVDTGNINAGGLTAYGVELGGYWRNFYAAGEAFQIDVDRSGAGADPNFSGWYVQAAWTLTGESHKWSAANGGFQGIRPATAFDPSAGHWGAWEIAARYSDLNLNYHEGALNTAALANNTVRGGEQTITTIGLNWYPNSVVRFLLDYQWVSIDRLDPENGVIAGTTIFGGAPSVLGDGAQIGQDYQVVSLRSQFAF
jgi:phosphate-selective porin OprO/OprP